MTDFISIRRSSISVAFGRTGVIVPGVIFDSNNNRMGFGKGYYDRFLKDKKCYKIGICFKEQITDNLPIDDYDIKMDEVVVD